MAKRFLSGINVTGISKFLSLADAGGNTDKFIVLSSDGTMEYRTSAETLSDIGGVPNTRQLTINGITYDLTANRSWTISSNINSFNEYNYTATANQTTFPATYTLGQLAVFYNGSKLDPSEYAATNGSTVVLNSPCQVGDKIDILAYLIGAGISLANLSATAPLVYNSLTGLFSITISSSTTDGYLSSTDWNTFNNKLSTASATSVYVPYIGANSNVDLGTYGLISDYLKLNVSPTSVPTTESTMAWNDTDGTMDIKLKGGNVTLQVGQENVVRIVNKTGATLLEADYKVVRLRSVAEGGAQGQRLAVVLAQGDTAAHSKGVLGLVTETIGDNQEGFITIIGQVHEIDTTGALQGETWVDGDKLYLSATTAGKLTKIPPVAPNHSVVVGYVEYAHAVHGKIFVDVNEGVSLDELHNVYAPSPTNNQSIYWNATNLRYENNTIAGILGYTPTDSARTITINGITYDLTANRTWTLTTSNIAEGSNLYYTDARVGSYLTANSYVTQSYVATQIANLVASSPAALDTLNELAAALGNDANFATTTATSLGNRLRVDTGAQGLTSTQQGYGRTNLGLGTAATSAIGDFATAAQGTKADSAFGWGNHASAGYLTTSSAASTYQPLDADLTSITGLLGTTGFLKKTAANTWALDTNTYLTGITSSQVTTALGFTPYNSTNPNGYISSYTETDTLASVTARGASTSTRTTFVELGVTKAGSDSVSAGPWFRWTNVAEDRQMLVQLNASNGLTYWSYNGSAWATALVLTQAGAATFSSSVTATGASIGRVVMDYDGTDSWFRMQMGNRMRITTTGGTDFIIPNTGNMTYNGNTVWHAGNLTNLNQLSNGPGYITGYTETDTLASVTGRGATTSTAVTFNGNVNANGTYLNIGGYIDLSGTLYLRGNVNYLNAASNGWNAFLARNGERFDGYFSNLYASGVITQNGNQVLHTGNYSSYALPLSGGTLTGTVAAPNFTLTSGSNFFYAANATYNYKAVFISNWSGAGIWGLGATSGHTLKFDQISGTNDWANATDLELYLGTKQVIHSGNISSQSVNQSNYSTMDYLMSIRNFGSGTLVQTSINYAVTNGDPFVLEIKGNSYGSGIPWDIQVQGYIYYDTIINIGGYSNGTNISGLRAINYGGNLCFWWPSQGYWHGFTVKVYVAYDGRQMNRVTSISDTGQPTSAKQVDFSPAQSLRTDNAPYAANMNQYVRSSDWVTFSTVSSSTRFLAPNMSIGYWDGANNRIEGSGRPLFITSYSNPITFGIDGSENIRISTYGQLLINAASSGYGSYGYGYNLGVRGNSSQAYISIAINNQTLDTQGLIIGVDTSALRFHGRDNKPIIFANNDTERVWINTSGALLINTSTHWNNEKLGVQIVNGNNWTNVPAMMRLTNYGSGYMTKMTFTDSSIIDGWLGMVPISGGSYFVMGFSGYTEQGFKVYQNGSVVAAGDVTAYSDIRVKENIITIDNALEKTLALRGVYYNRIDTEDKRKKIGVIAQEVQKVAPELVTRMEDDMLNVSYGNMAGLFIEAIKELKQENDELRDILKRNNII